MPDFYPYLMASLPMLHPGMKPPFSFGRFLEICKPHIPATDYRILSTLPKTPLDIEGTIKQGIVRKFIDFDAALRNELVKVRAQKKQIDPSRYLHPGGYRGSSLATVATAVLGTASLIDAEMALDQARWKALDDLTSGHHFDLDALVVYALKLRILIRWENIRSADPSAMLDKVLQGSRV